MPLLRLLHQISNMYQNVKDTQIELRSQTKISHRQNKHTSSSGINKNNLFFLFHETTSFTVRWRDNPWFHVAQNREPWAGLCPAERHSGLDKKIQY